ncbi:MAG TPA: serine dehydratase beta chain, partial [Magnetospirillaceae bacterium]|nr:serine dehydratase beta chain [Magnetospirillaceae bacterium]
METIQTVFKIGFGPSSSHTMGPGAAAASFMERFEAARYEVTLFGSLAATGKGHLTDEILLKTLGRDRTAIMWKPEIVLPGHPNALRLEAFGTDLGPVASETWYSVGGGEITRNPGVRAAEPLYELCAMEEILTWCRGQGRNLWEYVADRERVGIWDFLDGVWQVMQETVRNGLDHESRLPGPLGVARKASSYFTKAQLQNEMVRPRTRLFAYALASAEENASGGQVVTAPTCGSCGVLPAVLCHLQEEYRFNQKRLLHA